MDKQIELLKILSDKSRLHIIKLLIENGGDLCVNDIASQIKISPSAVSHQMAKLEENNLVEPVRNGQNVCYMLKKSPEATRAMDIINVIEK